MSSVINDLISKIYAPMRDRLCDHVSHGDRDGSRVPRLICDLSSHDDDGLPHGSFPTRDVPWSQKLHRDFRNRFI